MLNDPDIVRLRKRREERRIRGELREIGKKALSPNVKSNKKEKQEERNLQSISREKEPKSDTNFITFQKPERE